MPVFLRVMIVSFLSIFSIYLEVVCQYGVWMVWQAVKADGSAKLLVVTKRTMVRELVVKTDWSVEARGSGGREVGEGQAGLVRLGRKIGMDISVSKQEWLLVNDG